MLVYPTNRVFGYEEKGQIAGWVRGTEDADGHGLEPLVAKTSLQKQICEGFGASAI